jgi:RecB family exonuclease
VSKFPLSYSRVATFKKCPAQFEALYVNKSVIDSGNEYTQYGNRVHESLERYGKTGDEGELTKETRKWKPLVDKIESNEGDKYYEFKMAINADLEPCDWFADDVWFRGIADILVVHGDKAYCGDWKTGKSAYEDHVQLQIFAAMVMFHFPQVETVRADFIWLVEDKHTKLVFNRPHLKTMWGRLSDQFAVVQEAVDLGVFVAKPSRLCNWCAAKDICIYK